MAVIRENLWGTYSEDTLADFSVEFQGDLTIQKIFEIVEEVLRVSNRNEVCMIDIEGSQYLDYLKFTWDNFGYIYPYYLPGYKFYSNDFKRPFTRLFLYRNGEIVSESISELCKMDNRIGTITFAEEFGRGTFKYRDYDPKCGEMVAPITLSMAKVMKGQEKVGFWSISGSLKSDIWLEKVLRPSWDGDKSARQFEEMGNRELAYLNAPRLNSFLRGLSNIAQNYGGDWFLEFESGTQNHIINCLSGKTEPLLFPLNGEIIYQEDIDEGRVKLPES